MVEAANNQEQEQQGPTVEELQGQLEQERAKSANLTQRLDRFESLLVKRGLDATEGDGRGEERREPPKKEEPEPTYDDMSTKDVVQHVLGKIGGMLDEHGKRTDSKIASLRQEQQTNALVEEIASAMEDHPDLGEYQAEIVKRMAGNPNLNVEDAYFLAKKGAGKLEVGEKKESEGGLPPRGSRPGGGKPPEQPKSFSDAGAQAWKKLGMTES